MDKKIAGLLGAAAALTAVGTMAAATEASATPAPAASYRDLLEPVPNALVALRADDARLAETPASEGVRLAQHHHHHRWWRRRFRHHHHHHHHHHHY